MASRVDTHTHNHLHESDFKKPGARRPVPGLKIFQVNDSKIGKFTTTI